MKLVVSGAVWPRQWDCPGYSVLRVTSADQANSNMRCGEKMAMKMMIMITILQFDDVEETSMGDSSYEQINFNVQPFLRMTSQASSHVYIA